MVTASFLNSFNLVGFDTDIFPVPLEAMAFRFLEPITAPRPHLPAALLSSAMMLASLTSLSPAGPMVTTEMFVSKLFS
jgi:hypothetical protein